MYGVIPQVVPQLIPDLPIPVERIPAQEGTDFAYINQLASETATCSTSIPGRCPASAAPIGDRRSSSACRSRR